jgi:hypothetical protein
MIFEQHTFPRKGVEIGCPDHRVIQYRKAFRAPLVSGNEEYVHVCLNPEIDAVVPGLAWPFPPQSKPEYRAAQTA